MSKQDFLNLLFNHVVLVRFTKKDGTIRDLKCTLKQDVIDTYYKENSKPTATRTTPEHQVCAIDIEQNAFRSFTIDSVIDYEII